MSTLILATFTSKKKDYEEKCRETQNIYNLYNICNLYMQAAGVFQ